MKEKIEDLNKINTDTKEGKYLLAAIAIITSKYQTNKTPNEVLKQCYNLQNKMFKN